MRSWKGNTGFKNEEWKISEWLLSIFPHKDIHNNSILLPVIIPRSLSNVLHMYVLHRDKQGRPMIHPEYDPRTLLVSIKGVININSLIERLRARTIPIWYY